MKRKTVLLFLCLIVLLSATAGIVACKVEHKHAFTEQNVDEAYLASPATCTSSATYYYSCACGEKGTATFTSGNALNHSFTNYVSDGNATCTADGTKTAKCDRDGCNATDTVADEGSVIPHTFDKQVVAEQYLASAATCTEPATYYYSCACGEKGTATFASGNALNHSFTNYVSDGNATCTADGTKTAKCDRDGCNATDTVADEGSVIPHAFDKQVVAEQYLASAATCTEPATYYYSCACGEKGTATFTSGGALGHSYSTEWSYNQTEHWHAATCGHNVDSGRTAHSFDDNKKCTVCDYVTTKPLGLELQSTVFDIDLNKKTAYLKVANAVSEYDFSDKFSVADGARFDVCTDKQCNNKIASKRTDLVAGDNVFYILVTNGNNVASYTITLRRRPIYTVSFDTDGGSVVDSQQVEEDDFATEPTTSKLGYDFVNWNYDFLRPVLQNETITASWKIRVYDIIYDLNVPADSVSQNVDNSLNSTTYTVEDEITFVAPIRKGYTATWSITKIEKGTVGKIKVVAIWTAIDYQITYDFGDTSSASKATNNELNPSTYTIEDEIAKFDEPTRTGYTFIGWDRGIAKGTTEAQTIAASWQIIVYNISYDLNGGENVEGNPATYTVEDEIVLSLPLMTGYTGAWDNGGKIEKGSMHDATFSASYTINQYNLVVAPSISDSCTFIDKSGAYDYNTSITLEISEVFIGYNFIGWYNGDSCLSTNKSYTFNVPANNIELTVRVSVIEEMRDFVFTSTTSTCKITGTTDKTVVSVTIPDCVTSISASAFSDCSELTNIKVAVGNAKYYSDGNCIIEKASKSLILGCKSSVIPANGNVNSIGSLAFKGCSGLTSVTIPDSVTSIGNNAFAYCSGLTSVTIPGSVTSIEGSVFYNCNGLTTVTIPNSVTSIGNNAFRGCTGLTSVTIPDGVTSIDAWVFSGCTGLTSVTIGSSVTSIGSSAFRDCTKLVEVINNSSLSITKGSSDNGYVAYYALNVKKGGSIEIVNKDGYLFYTYDSVNYLLGYVGTETELTLPNNYNGQQYQIYKYAFYNCNALISVTIGSGVTSIGSSAFSGCSGLTSVTIPDSVTLIGSSAFSGCSGLESITLPFVGGSRKTSSDDYQYPFGYIFGTSSYTGGVGTKQYCYYYGSSSTGTKDVTYYIPSSLKSVTITGVNILYGAFYNCSGLTSVTIGSGVTSIGERAFRDCSGLTSVIWNAEDCTSAGSYYYPIFENCTNLTTVTIGDNVKTIPSYAFRGCSGLTSITIPDSVTTIGSSAFYGCSGLTSVTIGSGVTLIGSCAFSGCYELVEVINNSSLSITKGSSDYGDVAYYALNVKKGGSSEVVNQDGYLFYTYNKVNYLLGHVGTETELTLPNNYHGQNYQIYKYAFKDCRGLTSITIGSGVTSIGYDAFSGCSGLTSVTIPDSVTSIGELAFNGCSGLKYNEYDNALYLGNNSNPYVVLVEAKTTKITSCNINETCKIIYYDAFSGCRGLTSIKIPDSVTTIGSSAFRDCSGLTSITIGSGVTSIGNGAFSGCYKLVEVINNSSLSITKGSSGYDYVAFYALNVKKGGSSEVVNQDGYLFYTYNKVNYLLGYAGNETELTLPENFNGQQYQIYKYAFYNCNALISVTIGSGITSIGKSAFYDCSGLTSITIPDSVTSIGELAFSGCSGLKYNEYDNALYLGNQSNPYVVLIKPKTTGITSCDINEKCKVIYSYAFSDSSGLTSVTIPNSVTSIGSRAFDGCYKLVEVINNSSLSITNGSYNYGYVAYYALNVKKGGSSEVVNKDGYLFYTYNSVNYLLGHVGTETELTLPNNYNGQNYQIYKYAFYDCSRLTSITIPDSVTSIGSSAFYFCSGLTSVTIGNGVTSIGDYAFRYCSGLTSIEIPDSVTSIGYSAFYGCSGLKTVYYKGGKTEWGKISIGYDNSNLTSATRYYYSETEPALNADGTAYNGNYWHYAADGTTPVIWKKEN